jgi:calcineurin-like phosphoesterase family protein
MGAGPRTFFTADLHFGHLNIIEYAHRPFRDVDHMNAELVRRWNAVVTPGDTVWVLGDFAMGRIADTLPIVASLNGCKILLAGNHDRCSPLNNAKWLEWTDRYLSEGFSRVIQGDLELARLLNMPVTVSHFPYVGDHGDEDRYVAARPRDRGNWLLHGHVHNEWKVRGRMVNVGVDVWDYAPVSTETLNELIRGR